MKRSSDPVSTELISPEKKAREEAAVDSNAVPGSTFRGGSGSLEPLYRDPIGALFVEDGEGAVETDADDGSSQCQRDPAAPSQPSSPDDHTVTAHEEIPACHFFARGMCRNGTSCPFRHDPKSIICTYYLHGNCRNGSSCRFSHELPDTQQPAVEEGDDGPPPDVCKFFWHGSCRAGSSCRWRHVKAPSRLSAAPPPNLPAKANPLVSERAKALLERHSISRIAQESGASEIVVKARAPATKFQR